MPCIIRRHVPPLSQKQTDGVLVCFWVPDGGGVWLVITLYRNCNITYMYRICIVYVSYIYRIYLQIICTKWRCFPTQWFFIPFTSILPHYHIKKCVDILGGRTYPVRYYPIALRLRDREGRAFLCITLNPQSGDSSGVMLGVRSVALLHLYLMYIYRLCLQIICMKWRHTYGIFFTSKNTFFNSANEL